MTPGIDVGGSVISSVRTVEPGAGTSLTVLMVFDVNEAISGIFIPVSEVQLGVCNCWLYPYFIQNQNIYGENIYTLI